jgi:hypothetical protein
MSDDDYDFGYEEITKCGLCGGEDEDLIKAKIKKIYQCKKCRTVFTVDSIEDKNDWYEEKVSICSGKYCQRIIIIPNYEKKFKLNDRGDIVHQED